MFWQTFYSNLIARKHLFQKIYKVFHVLANRYWKWPPTQNPSRAKAVVHDFQQSFVTFPSSLCHYMKNRATVCVFGALKKSCYTKGWLPTWIKVQTYHINSTWLTSFGDIGTTSISGLPKTIFEGKHMIHITTDMSVSCMCLLQIKFMYHQLNFRIFCN